jgi:hypothetical protein
MKRTLFLLVLFTIQATGAKTQLHLSPVNTGDCVAARIATKRTTYVDEFYKKYCAQYNRDKAVEKKCIENLKTTTDFSFFTDRCSENDYFIGINGEEIELRRVSKKRGKPTNFMGSFAGNGIRVVISNARLTSKTYFEGEARNEDNVENATYKVNVRVTTGGLTKTFKDVTLSYGL